MKLDIKKHSPLEAWLARTDPLRSFLDLENSQPNFERGGFLLLNGPIPLHETISLEAESLPVSWKRTHEYVKKCLTIIDAEETDWLDHDEVRMIRAEVGEPPPLCFPIYLLSVGQGKDERVVYVGKTSSKSGRFKSGHAAITGLHHPKYDGLKKQIYLGGVVLLSDDDEYRPLEWVKPLAKSEEILTSIEAELIFHFQPELNTIHKKSFDAVFPVTLHIQNYEGDSPFLNDRFVWSAESNETEIRREHYLTLRSKYLPTDLKVVFILESPPASGKYFYDEEGSINEPLFSAMMELLGLKPSSKRDGLRHFADSGHFLVDAIYEPVNELKRATRDNAILRNFDILVADLEKLADPREIKFILVKANVCRLLEERLLSKGFNVRNNGVIIPFPSNGQQGRFLVKIHEIGLFET